MRTLLLACRQPPSGCVHTCRERGGEGERDDHLVTSPGPHLQIPSHRGVRVSIWEFLGEMNTQSITMSIFMFRKHLTETVDNLVHQRFLCYLQFRGRRELSRVEHVLLGPVSPVALCPGSNSPSPLKCPHQVPLHLRQCPTLMGAGLFSEDWVVWGEVRPTWGRNVVCVLGLLLSGLGHLPQGNGLLHFYSQTPQTKDLISAQQKPLH